MPVWAWAVVAVAIMVIATVLAVAVQAGATRAIPEREQAESIREFIELEQLYDQEQEPIGEADA